MQDETGRDWLKLLESHDLDMAIVSRQLDTPSVGCCALMNEALTLVARADLLEAKGGDEKFLAIPYLSHIEKDLCTCRYLKIFSTTIDISTLKQGTKVNSFRMMKELLLAGTGFGILPLGMVEEKIKDVTLKCYVIYQTYDYTSHGIVFPCSSHVIVLYVMLF